MVRTIIGVIILIAIIRLQIFLSKKDNRLLGLIIPIVIFDYSLVIAPVVADLCTTPVALSAPPNSYQNNSQS